MHEVELREVDLTPRERAVLGAIAAEMGCSVDAILYGGRPEPIATARLMGYTLLREYGVGQTRVADLFDRMQHVCVRGRQRIERAEASVHNSWDLFTPKRDRIIFHRMKAVRARLRGLGYETDQRRLDARLPGRHPCAPRAARDDAARA